MSTVISGPSHEDRIEEYEPPTMMRPFTRLLSLVALGSYLLPVVIAVATLVTLEGVVTPIFVIRQALMACSALMISAAVYFGLRKLEPILNASSLAQADFLDRLDTRFVDVAIPAAAALSLFLELAIIRWQSSIFEFFAFYKNFGVLACFVGLGIGYAMAGRDRIPLVLTIPSLAWQFGLMIFLRYGFSGTAAEMLRRPPFREQLNMWLSAANFWQALAIYALLSVVFGITALAFIPIGQLCGRLMERRSKLKAYGLNLLGSLAGVVLMLLVSFLWTPPAIWFSLCFLAVLLFSLRTPASLLTGTISALISIAILTWPVNPLWQKIYSPYQLLEVGHANDTGLMLIRAAGHYYQRVHNLSNTNADPNVKNTREYYGFAYRAHSKPATVAVVGAGTGNDVAAALRAGAGHVDAIEIDPAILLAGKANHPEKPYDDPRVQAVENDARSFLRTTANTYDMVVYGLLDSHTLLSQGSSVRLDSFVYTVEGLREARRRLKGDGVLSLSFTVLSDELGRKIYLMLQNVFDGRPPVCVRADYDRAVIFLESNDKNWKLAPELISDAGFQDYTARYADSQLQADVSTDDWPFFYMPRRVYPVSYLIMVCQILVLSIFLTANFLVEKPGFSQLSFFFLGVGFMLVETKGITELGLTFGNTWQVIGVVIAGILLMAFLANCAVQSLRIRRPFVPYVLLWASLAVGWSIARAGGFPPTAMGRIAAAVVLTCPMFFSGMVFSTLLSGKGTVSGIMALNLVGAVVGGLLEYNSMYFGFQSLYLVAIVFYVLAFVSDGVAAWMGFGGDAGGRARAGIAERSI